MSKIFTREYILFLCILTFGLLVRLYKIEYPIADWHSWRQVDTSAVSRNFVINGFEVLHPRFNDISNVPSGKDNPEGYRFVEFPIYNVFQATFYIVFNTFSLEIWGRLTTIISTLLAGTFLYLLVKLHADYLTALCVFFIYLILPFSIYYGRTILPDPTMIMAILGGIYFFDRWSEKKFSFSTFNIIYISSIFIKTICVILYLTDNIFGVENLFI